MSFKNYEKIHALKQKRADWQALEEERLRGAFPQFRRAFRKQIRLIDRELEILNVS